MMARPLGTVVVLVLVAAASSCAARDFYVGGRDGWTPNPGEPHNKWAELNRFQVNDTLVFRYNKDVDGVLLVSQSHYDACDVTKPFLRLDGGGDSRFVLDHSGPYFFISGDTGRCLAGERLVVVVLAIRDKDFRNIPSPLSPPPPPPKSASPASLAPPPGPASSSTSAPPPPPVPSQTPPPPPSPSAGNVSSHSPAPLIAPVPVTNGTCAPSMSSAAVALRAGVLACFVVVAGAALL